MPKAGTRGSGFGTLHFSLCTDWKARPGRWEAAAAAARIPQLHPAALGCSGLETFQTLVLAGHTQAWPAAWAHWAFCRGIEGVSSSAIFLLTHQDGLLQQRGRSLRSTRAQPGVARPRLATQLAGRAQQLRLKVLNGLLSSGLPAPQLPRSAPLFTKELIRSVACCHRETTESQLLAHSSCLTFTSSVDFHSDLETYYALCFENMRRRRPRSRKLFLALT